MENHWVRRVRGVESARRKMQSVWVWRGIRAYIAPPTLGGVQCTLRKCTTMHCTPPRVGCTPAAPPKVWCTPVTLVRCAGAHLVFFYDFSKVFIFYIFYIFLTFLWIFWFYDFFGFFDFMTWRCGLRASELARIQKKSSGSPFPKRNGACVVKPQHYLVIKLKVYEVEVGT